MAKGRLSNADRPTSPAYSFVAHAAKHCGDGLAHSWDRLRAAIDGAARLAITAGMRWDAGDLAWLAAATDPWACTVEGQRMGPGWGAGEDDYRAACTMRGGPNMSFCKAFEGWKGRKPFILKSRQHVTGQRLSVGEAIDWYGERLEVTSFAADGSHLIACAYKPSAYYAYVGGYREVLEKPEDGSRVVLGPVVQHEYERRAPTKLVRITLEEVREASKAFTLARGLEEALPRAGAEWREQVETVLRAAGVERLSRDALYALRLPVLEALADASPKTNEEAAD